MENKEEMEKNLLIQEMDSTIEIIERNQSIGKFCVFNSIDDYHNIKKLKYAIDCFNESFHGECSLIKKYSSKWRKLVINFTTAKTE